MNATYNGWKNRETWNVALWIGNDKGLYDLAMDSKNYPDFRRRLGQYNTPDGISYYSPKLSIRELNRCIKDLRS